MKMCGLSLSISFSQTDETMFVHLITIFSIGFSDRIFFICRQGLSLVVDSHSLFLTSFNTKDLYNFRKETPCLNFSSKYLYYYPYYVIFLSFCVYDSYIIILRIP